MLDKERAFNEINNVCKKHIGDKKWAKETAILLNEQTNLPIDFCNDVLTLRIDSIDVTDFEMFLLLKVLKASELSICFTDSEIKEWDDKRYAIDRYKFPIRWKMLKIADDQWIGKISTEEIIHLRNSQLINYDENQQRTLRRVEHGDSVFYKIDVDHKQVKAIEESFMSDAFIPNTITLNIPEDADFYYDEYAGDLVINAISMFNIIDGYHRYLAISNVVSKNKDFDYDMELRVVCFSQQKAQQFIWQEDQKHKMRKIDSISLNQHSIANKIVNGLNMAPGFDLAGEINRNSGIINSAELSCIIDMMFVTSVDKNIKGRAKEVELKTRDLLKRRLNAMVANDVDVVSKKWSYPYMLCAIFICSEESVPDDKINFETQRLFELISDKEYSYLYKTKVPNKVNYNRLKKIYEGM